MNRIVVVSDIHHACAAEQARRGYEERAAGGRVARVMLRAYRRFVWLDDPMAHNHRLPEIIRGEPRPDVVVGNGDFCLDTAFVGVSDDAALASAGESLGLLRSAYGDRFMANAGDHEFGKKSFVGGAGGVRRLSLERCESKLGIPVVWSKACGRWHLVGVASSVADWPLFERETPEAERGWWRGRHEACLAGLAAAFDAVPPGAPILFFCHDPSALPRLRRLPAVAARLPDVRATVIGHLHTPLVLGVANRLAGCPTVGWLGNSVRRYTSALREARCWRDFRVTLCPSPAGIQLLKDGGYLTLEFDASRAEGLVVRMHRLPW